MRLMTELLARLRGRATAGVPLLQLNSSDGPVYAVGDLHGCRALLRGLEALIQTDAAQFAGRPRIVLLGDMADRGPDTAGLIDDILCPLPWAERLAIRGNHEEMMLAFLEDPARNASWLNQGGYETLRSYGLALDPSTPLAMPRRRLQQMLAAYLPEQHLAWLRELPAGFVLRSGDRDWVLAHAGFDPDRSFADQPAATLVWGGSRPAPEGRIRLVHGHLLKTKVDLSSIGIGIDTGAYKTGTLTALRLVDGTDPSLLSYVTSPS